MQPIVGHRLPAQNSTNSRQKFHRVKGLRQVIIRTQLQPIDPIRIISPSRQHNNGHQIAAPPQLLAQAQTILSGQINIQNQQIKRGAFQPTIHLATVSGNTHIKLVLPQKPGQQTTQTDIIINDQYAPHHLPLFSCLGTLPPTLHQNQRDPANRM